MIVFYDFETTGFVEKGLPIDHERQPHIVQAAAIVIEDDGSKVASFDLIVRPDGWVIPDRAAAVHGISTERAARLGVPEGSVFRLLRFFMRTAGIRVAHNEAFDWSIMEIASHRYDHAALAQELNGPGRFRFCTMEETRNICRIPPTDRMVAAGITEFKSPRLEEAYRHLFGEPLDGAHDAMVDVSACKRIYEHLAMGQP